jgi:hypothetical protein
MTIRSNIWKPKDPSFAYSFSEVEKMLKDNTFKTSYASRTIAVACSLENFHAYFKKNT